jgi:superfamily II DNA or RNA helicase
MIYDADENAKVLVFMPLIDLCGDAAYFFNKELNYDPSFKYDLNIKTINSRNSARENYENRRADVIVTTIQSCGTGTDIPGITDIINCSPFVSQVTAKQVFGRIRYCGKDCHFYDVYDASVRMDGYWIKSRSKVFKQLSTKTNYITWEDDAEEDAS